jgi:N-acetylneuraminic acid mutarotase
VIRAAAAAGMLAIVSGAIFTAQAAEKKSSTEWPPLPEAVASFGAVDCDGWLYVYGGHTGTAHEHSKDNLSKHFSRLKLDRSSEWESLPMPAPLQGMPLVAYEHQIYRIGGLNALNAADEPEKLVSVADVGRYDPASRTWHAATPLPEGRSSHDAAVVGDTVYVLGGWKLGEGENVWFDHGLKMKLSDKSPAWEKVSQPFKSRALAVEAHGKEIFVFGGLIEKGVSKQVDILNTETGEWRKGPELPGKPMDAVACSAASTDAGLFVSGMGGDVLRYDAEKNAWTQVGKLEHPRFHHRFIKLDNGAVLAIGGASQEQGHLDSLERFAVE